MKAVNLFSLSRVYEDLYQDNYTALSGFEDYVHKSELPGIKSLCDKLMDQGVSISELEDFFYSYRIPHISKEFDLIKLSIGKMILNIELKSGEVNTNRMKKQLLQNISYLKHLKTEVVSFTYVSELDKLYMLTEGRFLQSDFSELAKYVKKISKFESIQKQLDDYFQPSIFMVSPLTHTEKFLAGEYFLTEQQRTFKEEILESINQKKIFGITGEPGTGKTLFLYDLARELAKKDSCLVIHGAKLCQGQRRIDASSKYITVKSVTDIVPTDFAKYDYILIDELQRIYLDIASIIDNNKNIKSIIVSYDREQVLNYNMYHGTVLDEIKALEGFTEYKLTNLFRISKHIGAFYKTLFNRTELPNIYEDYSDIDILNAGDRTEAEKLIELYIGKDYTYIKCYNDNNLCADKGNEIIDVIGQEYDRVLTVLDDSYYYTENDLLVSKENRSKVFDPVKMFYQSITRTRDKLCIIVVNNYKLFGQILEIKNQKLRKKDK